MTSFPLRAAFRLWLAIALILVGMSSPLVTDVARAQSELFPGATALVANTGGDPVLLRETPTFDAAVLSSFPEGTPADIVEGPLFDADGVAWLGVSIGGLTGYIVAGYLSDGGQSTQPAAGPVDLAQDVAAAEVAPTEETAVEPPAADTLPAPAAALSDVPANPVATADLNLRAGPSYDDMVLQVIPARTALTATGDWSDGFVGVDYQGQYGWVDSRWLGAGDAGSPDATLLQTAAPDPSAIDQPAVVDQSGLITDPTAAPAGDSMSVVGVTNLRRPRRDRYGAARFTARRRRDDHRRDQRRLGPRLVQRHLGLRQRRPPELGASRGGTGGGSIASARRRRHDRRRQVGGHHTERCQSPRRSQPDGDGAGGDSRRGHTQLLVRTRAGVLPGAIRRPDRLGGRGLSPGLCRSIAAKQEPAGLRPRRESDRLGAGQQRGSRRGRIRWPLSGGPGRSCRGTMARPTRTRTASGSTTTRLTSRVGTVARRARRSARRSMASRGPTPHRAVSRSTTR